MLNRLCYTHLVTFFYRCADLFQCTPHVDFHGVYLEAGALSDFAQLEFFDVTRQKDASLARAKNLSTPAVNSVLIEFPGKVEQSACLN